MSEKLEIVIGCSLYVKISETLSQDHLSKI